MAEQVHDSNKYTGDRLPDVIKPINYELLLEPNLDKYTFSGTVKIHYEALKPVEEIVLHAHEIEISEGHAIDSADQSSRANLSKVTYTKDTETATLAFDKHVAPKGVLVLSFTGTLNDKMKGFYRTSFNINTDSGDHTVYAATTQFEANDARKCFPCWDEPAVKATFDVTLRYVPTFTLGCQTFERISLSNMPIKKELNLDGLKEVSFERTPKMSTYLLAFIIGPFEKIECQDAKGRPIRVYTTPGKSNQGQFALEVACKSLVYYENYFNVAYPLPKMDLIAIPDFLNGAMENWGLVTYRETCLLVDPENTATLRKQYVALVVAHELAHQWFGNLVTMEWWTHLWLNEGFATFMEYLCVDHIFPEYDIWSQFVSEAYSPALSLDSLDNSHPIEVPVKKSSEIDEIFDNISYLKGASVIRMLYDYIGDDNFRRGMKDYLNKFAYKNASTEDLWDSLGAASQKPVARLMSGWTSQKGYPWLSIEFEPIKDAVVLRITQSKFTADGQLKPEDAQPEWVIPIASVTGETPGPNHGKTIDRRSRPFLLEGKKGEVTIARQGDTWVKLNPGTTGLYRTAYPVQMMRLLERAISEGKVPPMDVLGIEDDFFALCQAGHVRTFDYFNHLLAYKKETNYIVWCSIDAHIGKLNSLLSNTDLQDRFKKYARELYERIFKSLTWSVKDGETHTDAMLRPLVLNRLVALGHVEVIEEAKRKYSLHQEKKETIPADLRAAVYRATATYGDDASFGSLFEIYRSDPLHEEKNRALRALGFATDPSRIQRVIDFTMSDEVRSQDKIFAIMTIGATKPDFAWQMFLDHKDKLKEKYLGGHLMSHVVKSCTSSFTDEAKAKEIEKFFEVNQFPGTERTVQQSLETIKLSANWLSRDLVGAFKAFSRSGCEKN